MEQLPQYPIQTLYPLLHANAQILFHPLLWGQPLTPVYSCWQFVYLPIGLPGQKGVLADLPGGLTTLAECSRVRCALVNRVPVTQHPGLKDAMKGCAQASCEHLCRLSVRSWLSYRSGNKPTIAPNKPPYKPRGCHCLT